MTLSDYRSLPLWKSAIDLGPALARLADDLPAAEASGLSQSLRRHMIELPAAIATDQLTGGGSRHAVALQLIATLELIERVYPALDTVAVRNSADSLVESILASGNSAPAVAPAAAQAAPAAAPQSNGSTAIAVSPNGEAAVPPGTPAAKVPILVEPTGGTQESHVQPNSGQ